MRKRSFTRQSKMSVASDNFRTCRYMYLRWQIVGTKVQLPSYCHLRQSFLNASQEPYFHSYLDVVRFDRQSRADSTSTSFVLIVNQEPTVPRPRSYAAAYDKTLSFSAHQSPFVFSSSFSCVSPSSVVAPPYSFLRPSHLHLSKLQMRCTKSVGRETGPSAMTAAPRKSLKTA